VIWTIAIVGVCVVGACLLVVVGVLFGCSIADREAARWIREGGDPPINLATSLRLYDLHDPRPRVIHVANAGDDWQGDGSESRPYRTIARACKALRDGHADKLVPRPGDTFDERGGA
jgi:hypothetical protein